MTDLPPPPPFPPPALSPPTPPGPRSVSYLSWRVTTLILKALLVLATTGVVAEIVIWLLTFASPSFTTPDWIFAPFFAFGLLGLFVTVGLIAITHRTRSLPRLVQGRHLPYWLVGAVGLLGIAFIIVGPVQLFSNVPGQPGYNAFTKQYYFDDHGHVIPTDRVHYLSGVATQTRGFLSFAIVMGCVIVLLSSSDLLRRQSVSLPRLRDIPRPPGPLPRWCPPALAGVAAAALGLVVTVAAFTQIVDRIDSYLAVGPAITTEGVTEQLTGGHWVVFTWCEDHSTDSQYECARLRPTNIVVEDRATGAMIKTAPDPSIDHISPDDLPAVGQLTFSVPRTGVYSLRLTREVPKGVFVDKSPGSIARSLVAEIVLTVLGLGAMIIGIVLYVRRVHWRLRDAPRVIVESWEA